MNDGLTNIEAEVLASRIADQGGWMIEDRPCRTCGNRTKAVVLWRPFRAKKDRHLEACLMCDGVKHWPRMESK